MPWLICGNVCNSVANNDDFMKLTAIILKQTRLNFQNVYYSLGNNGSFNKNDANSLRFKQIRWEPLDENHEKEGTTTKDTILALMVSLPDSL